MGGDGSEVVEEDEKMVVVGSPRKIKERERWWRSPE